MCTSLIKTLSYSIIFAMIEEIHFILHVVIVIFIIIHNVIWYNYIYSNTCTNKYNYTYSTVWKCYRWILPFKTFSTIYYTFLYLKNLLIPRFVYTVGKWKKFTFRWFLIGFSPLIFLKIVFLENYDRYEAETFRVY